MHTGRFRPSTATAVVIANMVGTGVFTSLGFQLLDIESGFVIMMLWLVGGMTALCGAVSYAELGAALPRSGGEYNFLTVIYHPAAGFISGWVSATVGFAAPTALAAITFGTYLGSVFPSLNATWMASLLVLLLTFAHAINHRTSGGTQLRFTQLKVLLILAFCLLGLVLLEQPQPVRFLPQADDLMLMKSSVFAVALIYVNYAYTGWNAATYLTSELEDPQRHLPIVLLVGTGVVILLYLLLNYTFLAVAPIAAMKGKIEVGFIAASFIFGESGGRVMGVMLALLLISTVSAMVLAGPRVLQVIGQDFAVFNFLARTNSDGIPVAALMFQAGLSLLFIVTASFESILVFTGFILGVNSFFTVAGVLVLRWRQPDLERPYRTWGYPLTPLIFLCVMAWTLVYLLVERPLEGWIALVIIFIGWFCYLMSRRQGATAEL